MDSLRRFVLCTFRPHGRLEGGRGSHRVPSLGFLLQGLSVAPPLYPKSTPTGFLPAAAVLRVLVALPFSGPLGPGVIMNSSCGWSQGSFAFPWGSFNFAHTPADNFSVTFSFVTLFRLLLLFSAETLADSDPHFTFQSHFPLTSFEVCTDHTFPKCHVVHKSLLVPLAGKSLYLSLCRKLIL